MVVGRVPQAAGTVFPESVQIFKLLARLHVVKAENLGDEAGFGNTPVNWLLFNLRVARSVKFPMTLGMGPLNPLELHEIAVTLLFLQVTPPTPQQFVLAAFEKVAVLPPMRVHEL